MAIKRKATTETQEFNDEFNSSVKKAFTMQQLESIYKEEFKGSKAELLKYLEENEDGVEITAGAGGGIKHELGSISFQTRKTPVVDVDVLLEYVTAKKLTLETLLNICKPKASDLEKILSKGDFAACISETKETESLVLKATSSFKEEIRAEFGVVEEEPKKKVAKKVAKKKVAKKVVKKAKSEVATDSEIDDILNA